MVKITKIVKAGFGSTYGSAYGFGSWTIGATSIEVETDLDLSKEEDREKFTKLSDSLAKKCLELHARDVDAARKQYPELDKSIKRREMVVSNEGVD